MSEKKLNVLYSLGICKYNTNVFVSNADKKENIKPHLIKYILLRCAYSCKEKVILFRQTFKAFQAVIF